MTKVKKKLNDKENHSSDRDNLLLCEVNIDVLSREKAEEVEEAPSSDTRLFIIFQKTCTI